MQSVFLWGEDMQKGAFFNLNLFPHCVRQHGLRAVLAHQACGAPGCRGQSEWQKGEKREQELLSLTLLSKPMWCGIVVWAWVLGWTGLNPSDLTLIKFKTYNQQSGGYGSFSLWGILGQSLKQINLHLNTVFALNLELPLAFLENMVHLILIYVYICICLNVRKIVHLNQQ